MKNRTEVSVVVLGERVKAEIRKACEGLTYAEVIDARNRMFAQHTKGGATPQQEAMHAAVTAFVDEMYGMHLYPIDGGSK